MVLGIYSDSSLQCHDTVMCAVASFSEEPAV